MENKVTTYFLENTSTRKSFDSLDETKEHIKKKKVVPNDLSNTIKVRVETISYEYITVETDSVSKEYALLLLTAIKDSIGTKYDNISNLTELKNKYLLARMKGDKYLGPLYDFVMAEGFDLNDSNNYDAWYTKFQGMFGRATVKYLNYMIDNFDEFYEKANWLRMSTNYKPCSGIGCKIEIDSFSLCIYLRPDSILFGTSTVYGRNVSFKGEYKLTDKDVKKRLDIK